MQFAKITFKLPAINRIMHLGRSAYQFDDI